MNPKYPVGMVVHGLNSDDWDAGCHVSSEFFKLQPCPANTCANFANIRTQEEVADGSKMTLQSKTLEGLVHVERLVPGLKK